METQSIERSQRINLGADNLQFSDNTYRKLYYFLAAIWLILFVFALSKDNSGYFEKFGMPSIYFICGMLYFFKAHFELSPISKYAPHFIISDSTIKIKTGVFKNSLFINWDDIKKIELGNYKIGIKDKTGLQYYPYKTRKETSIKIKRTIEGIAAQKGIEVDNLLKR